MPRRKLSEYRAKHIVSYAMDIPYEGWSVLKDTSTDHIKGHVSYVVKVDQAVKGRFKKGLVKLDVKEAKLKPAIKSLRAKGYDSLLVESYREHRGDDERYLSVVHDRNGYLLSYTSKGGVDVEANIDSIKQVFLSPESNWSNLEAATGITSERLRQLWQVFRDEHMVFLEINPYVVTGDTIELLDCAIEVDDAGGYYARSWTDADFRSPRAALSSYEKAVRILDDNSPASFNLNVLNKDGSIFLLLSGGGASVVVADEIYNQGYGNRLANYGEYSGNPTMHETYLYTKEIFELLLASSESKKVVFIGGAVANFTDIANTFNGVIQAIDEYAAQLSQQQVKIFVRRGGPRQELGLAKMEAALDTHAILGGVYDPSTSLTEALGRALKGLDT